MSCQSSVGRFPSKRVFRSNEITWAANETKTIPLDFLDAAVSTMGPGARICDIALHVSLTGGTGGGGSDGAREQLYPRALSRINIKDLYGERVDLSGAALRVLNYAEIEGFSFSQVRDLGASSGSTTIKGVLHIPCEPRFAARPQDYRMNVRALRAGEMSVTWSPAALGEVTANQITLTAGTLRVYVTVIEENDQEQKFRTLLKQLGITANEQTFQLGGMMRIRGLYQYIGEVGESDTTPDVWADQDIYSQTFAINGLPGAYFRDQYRLLAHPRRTASALAIDETDPALVNSAIPLFQPSEYMGITEMPIVAGAFDWKTSLTYGSGTFAASNKPQMIVFAIADRTAGEQPCGDSDGVTKTADGRVAQLEQVPAELVRKLPMKMLTSSARPR